MGTKMNSWQNRGNNKRFSTRFRLSSFKSLQFWRLCGIGSRATGQWSPNLFLVCQTKCPADIQCSAGHFNSLPDILQPDVQQIGSFLPDILCTFLCQTFPPHWPLSSSAWTLCPTFQNHAEHVRHIWRSLTGCWMKASFIPLEPFLFAARTWENLKAWI